MDSHIDHVGGLDELRDSIDRFVRIARARWRTFLIVFFVAVATVQLVAFFWPGTYEAHAAVLIQKTRISSGVDADRSQPTTVITGTVTDEEVNSEIAVLTSRQVLEATSNATGLNRLPPPWYARLIFAPLRAYDWAYSRVHRTSYPTDAQRALATLGDSIGVDRLRDSNILVISYRAGDPQFAEVVLNELLKQYLLWHVAVHSQMDVQPFFTAQATTLRGEISDLQQQLEALKARLGVGDVAAARDIAMRQHAALRDEEMLLRRRLGELDGKLDTVNASLADDKGLTPLSTTTRPESEAQQTLRSQVLELELEQITLTSRYTDSSPLVAQNRAKLAAARRALDEARRMMAAESTVGRDPTRTALQQESITYRADRGGTSRRLAIVEQQIEDSRNRVAALDQGASDAERLQLQLQSAKDRYVMYLDRSEKARVDAALDRSRVANVSIVQSADASLKPVRPKRLITLIASVAGGALIALLACAWLELTSGGLAGTLTSIVPRPEPAI